MLTEVGHLQRPYEKTSNDKRRWAYLLITRTIAGLNKKLDWQLILLLVGMVQQSFYSCISAILTFKGSSNVSFQQWSLNTRFAVLDEKCYPLICDLGKKKRNKVSLKVFYIGIPIYQIAK